jgi:predicted glycoside hydrolase/deacetylase ChbG (UPF0249 family)
MPATPALLINADDFGLHQDIDRGILDCIEHGRVQSISFSPQGQSLEWKKLAELQRHGIRVGLHVTLVGEPWLTDGRLIHNWKALIKELLFSPQMQQAVEAEIARQFQACAQHDLDPQSLAHVDSHQHVHAFGRIWQPCLALVHQFKIPRIRVPWCPSWRIIKKNAGGAALQAIASRRRRDVPGFLPCLAIAHAGHNNAAILTHELACGISAPCELVAHPGVNSSNLESCYADWHFDWTGERDALLSNEFADAVAANGFRFA